MNREVLAVAGSKAAGRLRVELDCEPANPTLRLLPLHDGGVGTFATVYSGRLGAGGFGIPVAVKIQRDQALTRENSVSVIEKFCTERKIHNRLQKTDTSPGREASPVVRLIELTAGSADEADELPPCLLCRQAPHALAPHCPDCGTPLEPDNWVQNDDERRLQCCNAKCRKSFQKAPAIVERILLATVQKDAACQGCPRQQGEKKYCQSQTQFLNFFPSRILLFELLDLDLNDYLQWGQRTSAPEGRARAWRLFQDHVKAREGEDKTLGKEGAAVARLKRIVDLFLDIVNGVERVHQLGPLAAHLDLKPENICLTLEGGQARAKIIDLGLAVDARVRERQRQTAVVSQLQGPFHAPELNQVPRRYPEVDYWVSDNPLRLTARLPAAPDEWTDAQSPPVAKGDRIRLILPRSAGVISGEVADWKQEKNSLFILANLPGGARAGVAQTGRGELFLDKFCGPAADIYSLGMLLLALLRGTTDLMAPYHKSLDNLYVWLRGQKIDWTKPQPNRLVARMLGEQSPEYLRDFNRLAQDFGKWEPVRYLAEELLGIALRCALRGPPGFGYLEERGVSTQKVLSRIRKEVEAVRRAADGALLGYKAQTDKQHLLKMLGTFRDWLKKQAGAATAAKTPAYDATRLTETLTLFSEGEADNLYRGVYGSNRNALLAHLDQLDKALAGRATDVGTAATVDHQVLVNFFRYCFSLDLTRNAADNFPEQWNQLVEGTDQGHRPGAHVAQWQKKYQPLVERLNAFRLGVKALDHCLTELEQLIILPATELSGEMFGPNVTLRVRREDRARIDDGAATEQLGKLLRVGQASWNKGEEQLSHFDQILSDWGQMGASLRKALAVYEQYALAQKASVVEAQAKWWDGYQSHRNHLVRYFAEIQEGVLRKWDDKLARRSFWSVLFGPPPTVKLRLAPEYFDERAFRQAKAALKKLKTLVLGPAAKVEAAFALAELESFRLEGSATAAPGG